MGVIVGQRVRAVDDGEAFCRLVEPAIDDAYRLAGYLLGNEAEAQDATHDAIEKAWASFRSLRDRELFDRWFRRILVNGCRDRLRRRARIRWISRSHDGVAWQKTVMPGVVQTLVAYPGRYAPPPDVPAPFAAVVTKPDGTMVALRSDDAITWQQSSVLPVAGGSCNLAMLACAPGESYDNYGANPDGYYYYSVRGETWHRIDLPKVAGGIGGTLPNSPDPMFAWVRSGASSSTDVATMDIALYVQWTAGYLPGGRRRRGGRGGGRRG